MAIDPRISLAGIVPQTQSAQTVSNIFQSNLNNAQNRRANEQNIQQQAALQPFQLQQAQQIEAAGEQSAAFEAENANIRSLVEAGVPLKSFLESGDNEGAVQFLQNRRAEITARGGDTAQTDGALNQILSGNPQNVLQGIQANETIAQQRGLLGVSQMSVGQRDFESKVNIVKNDPNLETAEGKAAAIALGLEAKASSAAQIQIAKDPELTKAVAESEATIAGAKSEATEGEKLKQQRKHKPAIIALSKLAEKAAIERGEVLTDLSRMEATLPGLLEVTSELKELATIATSTLGGKAYDAIVKQTGFGATKGSTARAKFIAIIDNQVLPLLKPTFGGSFTVGEGDALRATLGDPDATLEAKVEQINAFIAQKERDIRSKQTQAASSDEEFAGFKVVR